MYSGSNKQTKAMCLPEIYRRIFILENLQFQTSSLDYVFCRRNRCHLVLKYHIPTKINSTRKGVREVSEVLGGDSIGGIKGFTGKI